MTAPAKCPTCGTMDGVHRPRCTDTTDPPAPAKECPSSCAHCLAEAWRDGAAYSDGQLHPLLDAAKHEQREAEAALAQCEAREARLRAALDDVESDVRHGNEEALEHALYVIRAALGGKDDTPASSVTYRDECGDPLCAIHDERPTPSPTTPCVHDWRMVYDRPYGVSVGHRCVRCGIRYGPPLEHPKPKKKGGR